ncbi:hypothetical protein GGP41_006664 [Bipolaris sorokiniana]|uniref:Uncharacterized protein n=1 Tax=Cochliobolus sativus TaxID=45130 RepID=A0A8H6E030_COCSA|nr:hypothetical protein GGP41_006664 [Bipolaris sorokiniana]
MTTECVGFGDVTAAPASSGDVKKFEVSFVVGWPAERSALHDAHARTLPGGLISNGERSH